MLLETMHLCEREIDATIRAVELGLDARRDLCIVKKQ